MSKQITAQNPGGAAYRGNPPYYVPTKMLSDVLKPIVEELGDKIENEDLTEGVRGGIEKISQRVPLFMDGIKADSMPRRLWSILKVETMRTSTEIADSTLLAADRHMEDTNLPVFPAHIPAAVEMVDIHNEAAEDPVPPEDVEAFAKTIINFAKGFCQGLNVDADDIAEFEAAKIAAAFIRESAKGQQKRKRRVAVAA